MAPTPSKDRAKDRANVFTIGAAYGFVAGVFAMALVVWQFGSVVPTRDPVPTADRKPAAAANKNGPIVVAPEPAPTSGSKAADVAAPSMSAPPSKDLKDRDLLIPVEGILADQLTPQFNDPRTGHSHEALDIPAPTGTPVKAVEDGRIARLFLSKAGGTTIYQFDPSENYCYYYAHLDRYADGLREGDRVKRGQVVGYVGVSGNAPKNTPHLHFAVFRLTDQKRWWQGTPLDPYDILR
ncbi:MAG: M23 family metallopeptidase [Vicinamibacterales bacterium]